MKPLPITTETEPKPRRARPKHRVSTRQGRKVAGAVLAAVVMMGLACAGPGMRAQAATVLALDLSDLVERADVIAVGRVGETQARQEPHSGLIVTDVAFGVLRPLKGDVGLGDQLVITTLGGRLPALALSVPGEASFSVGETALVFLRRTRHGELRVVGMAQGRMAVSGTGGDAVVVPARNDMLKVPPPGPATNPAIQPETHPGELEKAPPGEATSAKPLALTPTATPAAKRLLRDVVADIAKLLAQRK